MLLNAENLRDLLWLRLWWRRHGTGNFCDCQEIDRRVLFVRAAVEVGLITCVWGRSGQAARHCTPVSGAQGVRLLPPNEVEDAEGLDKEHEGEDVTGGNRPSGPSNKDMTNETEMSAEKCATQIPFTLSQCGVPTLDKVQCCVNCAL